MKSYTTENLNNVALISHGGAGKTMLTDALLYVAGAIDRLGRIEDGTTTSDYDQEEIKRQISISASVAPLEWGGHKVTVIDTPGYFDFVGEVKSGLIAVDTALVLVSAIGGVEVGTGKVFEYIKEYSLPCGFVVNKLDRENADFDRTVDQIKEAFGDIAIPVQFPIGKEAAFNGVIDLLTGKAYQFDGKKATEIPVPADIKDEVDAARTTLIEKVAESNDDLLMKYLDGQTLTDEELSLAFRDGITKGLVMPIFATSATKLVGIHTLLDAIVRYLPTPAARGAVKATKGGQEIELPVKSDGPLAVQVWKTMADPYVGKLTLFRVQSGTIHSDSQVYNVNRDTNERIGQLYSVRGKTQEPVSELVAGDVGAVAKLQSTATGDTLCEPGNQLKFPPIQFPAPVMTMAVEPKAKGDEDKIGQGLARLTEEDPTFTTSRSAETKQMLISGMGDQHLEVMVSRLAKKFGVSVNLSVPKVAYRETLKGSAKAEGKHKKQTGGKGQFGHVFLELLAKEAGSGFEFQDNIFGGSVPRQFIPAVEKGVREVLEEGIIAGYPIVDIAVSLYDGSFHPVDSSEIAFKLAARLAMNKAFMDAKPIILEPIMAVEVFVPEEFMGDVIGDLNKKRGRVLGMDPRGSFQVVQAQVPASEMARYATDLRSMTQGRAYFTMHEDHYEEVPGNVAEQIIAAHKKQAED